MIAAPSPTLFDLIDQPAAFAVQFIDPVTFDVVSQGIVVSATGIEGDPIRGGSGRFRARHGTGARGAGDAHGLCDCRQRVFKLDLQRGRHRRGHFPDAVRMGTVQTVSVHRGQLHLPGRGDRGLWPLAPGSRCGQSAAATDISPAPRCGCRAGYAMPPATPQLGLRSMGNANGDFAASLLFPLKSTKSYPDIRRTEI